MDSDYKLLNINKYSSIDDIKKAYKKLILKHHPDKGGSNSRFIEVNEAYHRILQCKYKIELPLYDLISDVFNIEKELVEQCINIGKNISNNNLSDSDIFNIYNLIHKSYFND